MEIMSGTEETSSPLDGLRESDYPHLFSFVKNAGDSKSNASKCRATIDLLGFGGVGEWNPCKKLSTDQFFEAHPRLTSNYESVLLVVEDIDLKFIQYMRAFLGHRYTSFAQALDDFLDDVPTYNFEEKTALHLPPLQSTKKTRGHLSVTYNQAREFERKVEVSYDQVQIAAEGAYWRRRKCYGAMYPCQQLMPEGIETQFTPLFISRRHCVAWFDADRDSRWKTGIILVDPNIIIAPNTLPAPLSPPLYPNLLGKDVTQTPTSEHSFRTVFFTLTENAHRRDGFTKDPPPPFRLLEGIHRIIVAEWMVMHTYLTRDINTIEWRLQGGRGDGFKTTQQFGDVLVLLFRLRRRLNRYRNLVEDQGAICAGRGLTPPTPRNVPPVGDTLNDSDVWSDLVADYNQVQTLLQQDFDCVQQDINYIASLLTIQQAGLGVREAERTTEQNRVVLVLAVVATFILPIGTAATVLSMEGEWAPGGEKFGMFWAITVPTSMVFLAGMLTFMIWGGGQKGKLLSTGGGSGGLVRGDKDKADPEDEGTGIWESWWTRYYEDSKWVDKRRAIISERELRSEGV